MQNLALEFANIREIVDNGLISQWVHTTMFKIFDITLYKISQFLEHPTQTKAIETLLLTNTFQAFDIFCSRSISANAIQPSWIP